MRWTADGCSRLREGPAAWGPAAAHARRPSQLAMHGVDTGGRTRLLLRFAARLRVLGLPEPLAAASLTAWDRHNGPPIGGEGVKQILELAYASAVPYPPQWPCAIDGDMDPDLAALKSACPHQ